MHKVYEVQATDKRKAREYVEQMMKCDDIIGNIILISRQSDLKGNVYDYKILVDIKALHMVGNTVKSDVVVDIIESNKGDDLFIELLNKSNDFTDEQKSFMKAMWNVIKIIGNKKEV